MTIKKLMHQAQESAEVDLGRGKVVRVVRRAHEVAMRVG